MKIDVYKHKERYLSWKTRTSLEIPGIGKENSNLLKQYLADMEKGMNVGNKSVKGPRGYNRLNTIKDRFIFFCKKFSELYRIEMITSISEEQLINFFCDMGSGVIKKEDGGNYRSVETLARIFKAFWHWHQKVSKKSGLIIEDITQDLNTKQEKPDWVYLTEEQVRKLCNRAKYEYKVLFMLLFDSGMRFPVELSNIRVSDFYNDFTEVNIRQEIVKKGSFGRRIKLMLCSNLVKEYVSNNNLKPEDLLFDICPTSANKYLKRIAVELFGDELSEGGSRYSEISLYDFRHSSCCYWLPRYKSESALKYRFGWKKSDKIHYYSEMIGMKDTIQEEDLMIDNTQADFQKTQDILKKENELLKDRLSAMEDQMRKILELVDRAGGRIIGNKL